MPLPSVVRASHFSRIRYFSTLQHVSPFFVIGFLFASFTSFSCICSFSTSSYLRAKFGDTRAIRKQQKISEYLSADAFSTSYLRCGYSGDVQNAADKKNRQRKRR